MNKDTREAMLRAHIKGNFFPPLPDGYIGWAGDLLDLVESEGGGRLVDWDQTVPVPDDIAEGKWRPKKMRADGTIRLGDIFAALRLDPDTDTEDGDAEITGGLVDSWMVTDKNERFDFRVTVEHDGDVRPEEFDCYSDRDKAAWRRDGWRFVIVTVTPVSKDGGAVFTGAAQSLGAVEWGTLPGATPEEAGTEFGTPSREIGRESIWEHPAADLAAEAVDAASKIIDKL